jgi:hypothetical protein
MGQGVPEILGETVCFLAVKVSRRVPFVNGSCLKSVLAPVGLINDNDDILPGGKFFVNIAVIIGLEFLNRGKHHPAGGGIQHLRDNGFKLRGFLPGPAVPARVRSRTGNFQTMNRLKSKEIVPAPASSPSEISANALKVN